MPGHKLGRITEDVKRELSAILREVKDPSASAEKWKGILNKTGTC